MQANSWKFSRPPDVCAVIEHAAARYRISPRAVLGPSHEPRFVRARCQVIGELHKRGYSSPRIGRLLGGLHHSTVRYHLLKAAARCALPPVDVSAPDESGIWV